MKTNKGLYDLKNVKKWLNQDFESIRYEMITKNELWEDPLFPPYNAWEDTVWERPDAIVDNPCMYVDSPSRMDVNQGELDDCTILAGIQLLPLRPDLFKHVVPEDQGFDNFYAGVFHFRLWILGTWVDIVIDDRLPVWQSSKSLVFAYCAERNKKTPFWPMLLEKVFAKYYGGYRNMIYYCRDSLRLISGGITEYIRDFTVKDVWKNLPMSEILISAMENKAIATCHTYNEEEDEREDIVNYHAYGITKVFKCDKNDPHHPGMFLLRLRNPWGSGEWQGRFSDKSCEWKSFTKKELDEIIQLNVENDGEFWIEEGMFKRYFKEMNVCHLGPGQISCSHGENDIDNWKTSMFVGEWVKGVNSGGKENIPFNPRYNLFLDLNKNDINCDEMCTVIISLAHQPKNHKARHHRCGFFVEQYGKRVLKSWFGRTGDITIRAKLKPGLYDIIPCTKSARQEAKYLLRIYSESRFVVNESDDCKISKSPYIEEVESERDETGETIFQEFFGEQKEIDWKDLKLVLENALNKNNSSSSMITKIFSGILRTLWNVLSSLSFGSDTEHSNNGKVELSKNTVRSMIAMSNNNRSDKLDYTEFQTLWNKISLCYQIFKTYSEENQGSINVGNLRNALEAIGCSVNSKVLNTLVHRYCDEQSQISVNDFILCGVTLHTMMNNFEEKVSNGDDKVTVSLDEWVAAALY